MYSSSAHRSVVLVLAVQLLMAGTAQAAGEISQVTTSDQSATPFQYSIGGVDYAWGAGRNQLIEQFGVAGQSFSWATSADRVELVRRDVEGVASGEPCGVFVETVGGSQTRYQADYPLDPSGRQNCDVAAMLASRVVNRGALNVFNNAEPQPKNIERLDYLFDNGVLAPLDAASLSQAGHLVAEKSGNNAIKVAAVIELDVFGQPASYGDLVTINPVDHVCTGNEICYGLTDLQHDYAWLESESLAPQSYPVLVGRSSEPVAMAFVSAEALGLSAGQRYFGFSFFADDVNADDHDLLDVTTFPADTEDADILAGDDADIYGGVSGYFVGDGTSTASGDVFKDENGDGIRGDDEAGISAVSLTLHEDTDGNGVLDIDADGVVTPVETATNGSFTLPVLPDGNYFLSLDEADEDIPGGLVLAEGSNPIAFVVSGSSPDRLNFAFADDDSIILGDGSSTAGAATAGASGTATAGSATAGDGVSGEATSGSATAGADDSGTATAGTDDAGTATAGTATVGADDAGTATAGTATAGTDDAGTATGGTATAGADDAGTATAGTATAGTDDAGTATSGGGGDAGTPSAGASTSGDDGSNRPVATRDLVEVRQDTSVSIDVLANDIDPIGAGLTLVSADQPDNGTTEIVDGEVLYTPNYGFVGEDPFLYTLIDGAEVEAAGTVSVTVTRFSDLNNDGINDFDQCDGCDNLTLETGLDGTGVGRLLPFTLLLLLSLFGFRVWHSRRLPARGGQR